jgi:hypothetical protein
MAEPTDKLLDELRWYGKTIAGGGPMGGYAPAAKRAEEHWYVVTLPLLMELDAVYGPKNRMGCAMCGGQGVRASKACKTCKGSGMITAAT